MHFPKALPTPAIGKVICRYRRSETDDNDKDERSYGCLERHSHPLSIERRRTRVPQCVRGLAT
jgi:hypothetical protein